MVLEPAVGGELVDQAVGLLEDQVPRVERRQFRTLQSYLPEEGLRLGGVVVVGAVR